MSNPLVEKQPDLNTLYEKFKENPLQYLKPFNIPASITTPQGMVEYLLQQGKVPPQLMGQINAMRGNRY